MTSESLATLPTEVPPSQSALKTGMADQARVEKARARRSGLPGKLLIERRIKEVGGTAPELAGVA